LKIAIVIEHFESWRGGAETSTGELARLLQRRGHDVHIITATRSPPPPDLTIHGLRVQNLIRPLRTASFVQRAAALLEAQSFDVIHAISPLPQADVYQPRGGLIRESWARNVATRRSQSQRLFKRAMLAMNVKQRALLDLERAIFRRGGPAIAAVSQYVAEQCERFYGVTPPRVEVVFNGVDVTDRSEDQRADMRAALRGQFHVPDDALLLLFVAHNFRLKGLSPLIESAVRLVRSGYDRFRLLVVGCDDPVPFQRQAHRLGAESQIVFTGPSQRMEMFFYGADACVHPTYYDPCSRVVLEALCRGVPCITTRYNGAAEVITEGREGFVLNAPDDVDVLTRRIKDLADPRRRAEMGRHAADLRPRLGMARHVAELDALFQRIVEQRGVRVAR